MELAWSTVNGSLLKGIPSGKYLREVAGRLDGMLNCNPIDFGGLPKYRWMLPGLLGNLQHRWSSNSSRSNIFPNDLTQSINASMHILFPFQGLIPGSTFIDITPVRLQFDRTTAFEKTATN